MNTTMNMYTTEAPDYPESVVQTAAKYFTLLWLFLGVPGNILAGLVWAQRQMRPSSGIFLAVLALDEIFFLIFLVILEVHMKWNRPLLDIPVICQFYPVLMITTQQLSPLLVLSFTVQRYVAICHPFLKEKLCTMRKSVVIIIVLTVCCFCLNLMESYFWTMNENDICDLRESAYAGGLTSFWSIWHWTTELTIFGVVPFAILILNILVIKERKRLSEAEKALNLKYQPKIKKNTKMVKGSSSKNAANGNVPASSGSGNRSSATTLTLLVVSTYLIITVFPVTICYILDPVFEFKGNPPPESDIEASRKYNRYQTYKDVNAVIYEIGKSHYALNFFIYMMTGKMFRKQLKLLFYKVFRRSQLEKENPYRRNSLPPPPTKNRNNNEPLLDKAV